MVNKTKITKAEEILLDMWLQFSYTTYKGNTSGGLNVLEDAFSYLRSRGLIKSNGKEYKTRIIIANDGGERLPRFPKYMTANFEVVESCKYSGCFNIYNIENCDRVHYFAGKTPTENYLGALQWVEKQERQIEKQEKSNEISPYPY